MNDYNAVQLTENVYWVGAVDWSVRDFHGYHTGRGSTYNAYLILADKVTLVDTVKEHFMQEMLARVATVIPPEKIDYIVSNHSEMDHTGSLPATIEAVKPEKVFASKVGAEHLEAHFHFQQEITPVEDGGEIDLGNMKLKCFETRMLHWPDSMISYLPEEKVLFSQDAFGTHLASSERFADEIPDDVIEYEGKKYFANIILLYSPIVQRFLSQFGDLGLDLKYIAPDHGPIWRKGFGKLVEFYDRWSKQEPTDQALILFDTMWGSTDKMARTIADGIAESGARCKVLQARGCHRSEVVTDLMDVGGLMVGSPTLNNGIFPSLADHLTYAKGLKPKNLIGAAFGSFGWSGESVAILEKMLQEMKVELVTEGLKVKFVPDQEAQRQCHAFGKAFGEKLKERV